MKTTLFLLAAALFACSAPVLSPKTSLPSNNTPFADTLAARQMLETAQRLLDSARFAPALDTALLALRLNAEVSEGVDTSVANLLELVGRKCYPAGAFELMRKSFQIASETWKRRKGKKCPEYARTVNNVGVALVRLGKYKEAVDYLKKSLTIWVDSLGVKNTNVAKSYLNIGVVLSNLGRYKEALEYYEKSVAIKIEVDGLLSLEMFNAYKNIGDLYYEMGRLQDAEDYFEKSRSIALQLPDNGELLASIYNNLAAVYAKRKDYARAIDYHEQALALRIELYDEQSLQVAQSCANLGAVLMDYGNMAKALELNLKSLEIKQQIAEIDSSEIAVSYTNLGNVYALMAERERVDSVRVANLRNAIEQYYRPAEQIFVAQHGEGHFNIGEVRSSMASVFSQMGMPDSALVYYNKCLATYTATGGLNNPDVQRTYNSIALVYQKVVRDIPTAVRYLDTVLAKVSWAEGRKVHPDHRFNLFEALLFKGEILASVALNPVERAQARELLAQALALAEQYRDELERPDSKSAFMALVRQVLESSIRLEMAEAGNNGQHLQRIYEIASKNKAFLLFDAIRGVKALANVPDNLVKRENDLRRDILHYEKLQYEAERSTDPLDHQMAQNYDKQLFALQHERESLLRQFPDEYYKARFKLDTTTVRFVQNTLLAPQQSLLEYFVGDSAIYVFVIRKDTFAVLAVKNDFDLKPAVEGMLHGIYDHFKDESKYGLVPTAKRYADNAALLYQKLVAPVEHLLTRKVVVAPDDVLGYVPFDALLTERPYSATSFGSHPYWGIHHFVSYTYSANLLHEMQQKRHQKPPPEAALVAAPFCDGSVKKFEKKPGEFSGNYIFSRDSLEILAYSGEEARAIAQMLGSVPMLGQQADTASVLRRIGQCAVVHLSTHGIANFSVGDYAYLVFSVPGDSAAFVKLYVKDIYNLRLNADLVVLSACETGTGELRRGEGIISMARAFAYAGAKSITTTLWSVDDKQTLELMRRYYDNLKLKNRPTKDEALWKARQDYLNDHKASETLAHPFYWAAFVPVGDMQPLKLK